jgi:hypothetical protein
MKANRRHKLTLGAEKELERVAHAATLFSAAVAYFRRSAK